MKISELKEILNQVPDESEIILAVNGHYHFCDTQSHGQSIASLISIKEKPVFVFSADDCGFDESELNYQDLKVIKRLKG